MSTGELGGTEGVCFPMCMSTGVRNQFHKVMSHHQLGGGGTEGGCIHMCMSTGVKSAVNNSRKTFHRVMSHHEVNRMDALRNYFNEAFDLIACCNSLRLSGRRLRWLS